MTKAEDHFRKVAPPYMRKLMSDFPLLSKLDAAAIFGNLGHESLGFTALQEKRPTIKGSRGGFGWAQWTASRRRAYEAYCKRNGLDPAADATNYAYLWLELNGDEKAALPATIKAVGLVNKVHAFERGFLRAGTPHYDKRNDWAHIALDALDKAPQAAIPGDSKPAKPVPSTPTPIRPVEVHEEPLAPKKPSFFDRLFKRTPKSPTQRKATVSSWFSGIVASTAFKYLIAMVATYLASQFGLDEGNVTAILTQLVGVAMGIWGMSSAAENKAVIDGKKTMLDTPSLKADVKAAIKEN